MFRPIVTVALLAAGHVFAADYNVMPGLNTIQDQLVTAADGDTLNLGVGVYDIDRFVHVAKAVKIVGREGTIVKADGAAIPAAFYIDALGASLADIVLEDTSTGSSCQFEDPQPLNISFMYDLYDAPKGMHIYSNSLIIAGDAGPYFNTRALTDIHFGSCKLSTDNNKMSRGFLEIQTANCRANAGVSVAFNYMTNCGAEVTDMATITTYDAAVELNFEEEISMDEFEGESDFFAFSHKRTGEALAQMSISIDRLNKICTDVKVRTDSFNNTGGENGTDPTDGDSIIEKINAAITDLDLAAVNDNTSVLEISLVVPCPHGIYPLTATGEVLVDQDSMEDDQTTVSNWEVSGDCAAECADENSYCMQKLKFEITSCDLTATYHIQNLPLACVPGIVGCEDEGQHANITFNIDTNGLCEEDPFMLNDAFEPTVRLRSDDTYSEDRTTNVFIPDRSDTYWTIELWTNKTAMIIKSAEIQKVERHYADEQGQKIEGSCGEFDYFYNDDGEMTQMELDAILKPVFTPGVGEIMMDATDENGQLLYDEYGEVLRVLDPSFIPPKIDTIIPMTDKWLCEAGTVETMQNASSYMFCWYVIVEYEDSTARRRRRAVEEDSWQYDAFADIEDVQNIGGMDFMKRRDTAGGIGHGLIDFVPFAEGEFSSRSGIEDIDTEDDVAETTSISMAVGIGAGIVFGTVGLILCVAGAFYVKSQRAKEKEMMVYQKAFYPQGGMSAGGPPGQRMQPGGSMYQNNQNSATSGMSRGSTNSNSGSSSMYNRGGHVGGNNVSQRSGASQRSGHSGGAPRAGGSFYGMDEHSSV